ncbi:MAG: hypothetical protein C0459_03470 [Chitinophaga sp.]|jgi:hypothetical protein|nr:hypothetical protein [Chitinophaga sp.]
MFSIDYDKFLLQLLPSFLRTPKRVSYLKTLLSASKQLYQKFIIYATQKNYELEHNGQRYSIENVLNDRFDPIQRRIYNSDGFNKDRIYIYGTIENKPLFLPKYIYGSDDYNDTGIDFIVWIPNAIVLSADDVLELNALVKKYKLDGKRFKTARI